MVKNFLDKIKKWLHQRKPDRVYTKAAFVSSMSDVPAMTGDSIFIVAREGINRWAVFECPGGHKHRIEVNLASSRDPHWRLDIRKKKVSLWPSVWIEDENCNDHFWLRDGK